MSHDRLLDQMNMIDVSHLEAVFGDEIRLDPPDPSVRLAPVQRVAIITEAFLPKVDGVTKTAYLTLRYLQQTGREVLIFAPDISPHEIDGTRIVPLRSIQFPGVPETRMAFPNPVIARELHEFQPDLIHMFSPALMSVSGMANGRHMNVPIVANYQTDLPGYTRLYGIGFMENITRNWLRYVHNGCHLTLVPSEHSAAELSAHGFKRLRPWGRGVNGKRFNPAHRSDEWRAKLLNGRDPNSLLCIYVGRVAMEKRIDLLLEAAHTDGIALTIIGDGAERDNLEKLFAGTGTHFTGYLFGDDLPAAFASADVFLFTSPSETFGQVVQEAMASGLPTIITDKGGAPNLINHGASGLIVPDTPEAFKEAVIQLRDDPATRLCMAKTARHIAEQRPWEKILAQLEDYYTEAVQLNDRFVRVFGKTHYHNPTQIPAALIG